MSWHVNLLAVEALEHIEHRSVVIFEQPTGYVHVVVGRDADKMIVERAVMDRAQAKPVRDNSVAHVLEVGEDVGCIQQSLLS